MKTLKISSGEGILMVLAFCKALPAFAFLTIETREHNSFLSLIDRWFNPTVFST